MRIMPAHSILVVFSFWHYAVPRPAQKLMLAHVAINPSQGMLHLAKDSGILAKYGFTADVLLIPGTPRTIQALIAGDLDYVAAGAPASLRARAQGADVTILSTLANSSAQRVFIRPDSTLNSFMELKGKIIGVTQYGSGGDTFLARSLAQARHQGIRSDDLADGRHARSRPRLGVRAHRSRRAGRFGLVAGFSRQGQTVERRERARNGFSRHRRAADDHRSKDQSRPCARSCASCRPISKRFTYFQTNKAGTARILQKYMRGVSEEHISLWCDDLRAMIKQVPYADEEALRAEMEMMNIPAANPAGLYQQ